MEFHSADKDREALVMEHLAVWKSHRRGEQKKWYDKVAESREPWLLQIIQNMATQGV